MGSLTGHYKGQRMHVGMLVFVFIRTPLELINKQLHARALLPHWWSPPARSLLLCLGFRFSCVCVCVCVCA
jgi:hypothetical protein